MNRAVLFLPFLLFSCGYPGDTRAPSLKLPRPVSDLSAVERGSKVIVQFTAPTHDTEGLILHERPRLELHINDRVFTIHGNDPFVRYETSAEPFYTQQAKIWVTALNDNLRQAGPSNMIDLQVAAALAAPADLRAQAVPSGVQLTWKSSDRQFIVFRQGPNDASLTKLDTADARTYTDTTAEFGKAYKYAVQTIAPPAESDLSDTTAITPEDTFPPAVPAGLTAIIGTNSVELAWDRDTEPDLAGYRIYRAPEGGRYERIGESATAPTYSDRVVEHGKRYRYQVSAFDKGNHESEKSAPVEVRVP